jgi:D-lactate dehydrogenase
MMSLTDAARAILGKEFAPSWSREMPRAGTSPLPPTPMEDACAVYFPACINRIFGNSRHSTRAHSLPEALVEVSRRAGLPVWIPADIHGSCCSTVWQSKGYQRGNEYMARTVLERTWRWTDGGRLPVVVDTSSCTLGLTSEVVSSLDDAHRERHARITFIDSVAWAAHHVAPRLTVTRRVRSAAVHATCSMRHLGTVDDLISLVRSLADEVVVPDTMTCCGFAGDRGFLHPELTASATAHEAEQISRRRYDTYFCANRTCEIGMESATGAAYESVIFLLEDATRPASGRDHQTHTRGRR